MYIQEINDKTSTPVQRNAISQTSGTNIHNRPNLLPGTFGYIGENGKFSKPTQRRVSSYQFDENVIQLRRDDVQIDSSKWGKDKVGIGLTCHHVIPAGLLERFYNMCMLPPYNANNKIASSFKKWKQKARDSAKATGHLRARMIDPNDLVNYPNELSSACQWMSGNIFIGPDKDKRVDDIESGDVFDYGGYQQPTTGASRYTNSSMDDLKTLHTDIVGILNIQPRLNNDDRGKICSILGRLAKLADTQSTLHKRKADSRTGAYETENWVSVGEKEISGMENFADDFRKMYGDYLEHQGKRDEFREFCQLFAQYINMTKCQNITDDSGQYTMARHTYDILYNAWPH